MRITNCKTNHLTNPLGFDLSNLRVSWIVTETHSQKQAWARIRVALTPDMEPLLYDSGEACEASSLAFPIDLSLQPRTRYYWTVQVMAEGGETAVSDVNWFETAKQEEAWQASWITAPELSTENPVFTRSFTLPADTVSARIYATGLGEYQLYLDGQKVGREYLTPGCNHYDAWIQYQTYEVQLAAGEHQLAIALGNGWYKSPMVSPTTDCIYGDTLKALLEMHAQLEDGSTWVLGTDESWSAQAGPITFNTIYDGEVLEPSAAGGKQTAAAVLPEDFQKLTARWSLPVVVKQELTPKEILHTPAGETVLDMGQNFSGFIRFRCKEPKGTRIHLQYGEVLQDGNFYNENLRSAKAEYIYVSDGTERIIEPSFTFYGFRYVKVEGFEEPLRAEDFTGCVLHSDLEMTGQLSTGHAKVNQLISNVVWGQRSNYVDVPTDCPQRDERLGWTGDTQIFAGAACLNMDSYAFLNKYCHDLYTVQQTLGHVTHVVPPFTLRGVTCSAWGDAATIVPWTLYQYYGDRSILQQQYESMKGWADYIYSRDEASGGKRLWQGDFSFGDWLAMDHENPQERAHGGTDPDYISSAYYYYSVSLVAKAAKVLGKEADLRHYEKLAEEIRAAFKHEFFTGSGRLAVTTQTGYVLALFWGLAPEESRPRLIRELKKKLQDNGGYLKTGFVGTAYICKALSENGLEDLAYGLLLNEESPSWLYAVNLGATTIWERWNSMLANGKVNGTDMNSFNHYAYGAVIEWMYQYMVGLRPCEGGEGFKKVIIAPQIDERIGRLDMKYRSAAGLYEVHWQLTGADLKVKICVPFDAEAVLILPGDAEKRYLPAGEYEFTQTYFRKKEKL
ncbi:MAG: family 78 glycoside hydrolase catalytic domain [Lachnospiraceae bacterium]|jgi:alpha-L-rhamnosidase|nr:family 78 glycoside hydrolase catalytic domain [Lachnospiraceae bacterium]